MVTEARSLRDIPKIRKKVKPKDLELDLLSGSLLIDAFGEGLREEEFKLEMIKAVLLNLHLLHQKLDENSRLVWKKSFRRKYKKGLHHFLLLLPDDVYGGIEYRGMKVELNNRRVVYNMVMPLLYFE